MKEGLFLLFSQRNVLREVTAKVVGCGYIPPPSKVADQLGFSEDSVRQAYRRIARKLLAMADGV